VPRSLDRAIDSAEARPQGRGTLAAGVPRAARPPVLDRDDAHWRASRQWHPHRARGTRRVPRPRLLRRHRHPAAGATVFRPCHRYRRGTASRPWHPARSPTSRMTYRDACVTSAAPFSKSRSATSSRFKTQETSESRRHCFNRQDAELAKAGSIAKARNLEKRKRDL